MKKRTDKNFIAFTLSEMMIVLLIISVISAATLPAITSRDEVKAGLAAQSGAIDITSAWMPDVTYTKGYYYRNNANTDVIIGNDVSEQSAANKTTHINSYGAAALKLWRANPDGNCFGVNCGRTAIALFNKNKQYAGRIAVGNLGSLAIGKDAGIHDNSSEGTELYVGSFAGKSDASLLGVRNTIIGAYATYGWPSTANTTSQRNVILGANIKNMAVQNNNVIIGNYASSSNYASTTLLTNNYVGIGAYSGYAGAANVDGVNIGYYAGAKPITGKYYSYSAVNIGSFAGYSSYANGIFGKDYYGTVNLGYYAGALAYNTSVPQGNGFGVVNIGAFAGYSSVNGSNVNIGYLAGAYNRANTLAIGDYNVNIGSLAGASRSTSGLLEHWRASKNINIGSYAGYGTIGTYSIMIGEYAGMSSTQPSYSILIGNYAGYKSRDDNIAIGHYAGYGMNSGGCGGGIAITSNPSMKPTNKNDAQYDSVQIGCTISSRNISGQYKYCIGGKFPLTSELSGNSKVIWSDSMTGYTRQMMFVPGGVKAASSSTFANTYIYLYAKYVASWKSTMYAFSDRRLKENIKLTKYGIDKLRNIMVYQYNMIGNPEPVIGVIAQELMKYYPNAVDIIPEEIKKGGYYSVNGDWIIYSLAQSIKDVDGFAQKLSKTIVGNINDLSKVSKKVDNIEISLDKISQSQRTTKAQLDEINRIISKTERK